MWGCGVGRQGWPGSRDRCLVGWPGWRPRTPPPTKPNGPTGRTYRTHPDLPNRRPHITSRPVSRPTPPTSRCKCSNGASGPNVLESCWLNAMHWGGDCATSLELADLMDSLATCFRACFVLLLLGALVVELLCFFLRCLLRGCFRCTLLPPYGNFSYQLELPS